MTDCRHEQQAAARFARAADELRAIEHDLRWNNHGQAAAQIAALADRFEKDIQR